MEVVGTREREREWRIRINKRRLYSLRFWATTAYLQILKFDSVCLFKIKKEETEEDTFGIPKNLQAAMEGNSKSYN